MTDTGPLPPQGSTPPATGPGMPPPGQPIGYTPPAPAGGPYAGPEPTKDDRTMAMLAHLLGILGFLGPLIIWLIKKDQSPFVNDQGKEALNFHLTLLIGWVVGVATICLGVGLFIVPLVWVVGTVFSIIAALKANNGVAYRYPIAIRFIK